MTSNPTSKRMGWGFRWVSSNKSDFNYDFHVSATEEDIAKNEMIYNYEKIHMSAEKELPGLSVFYKDENGDIFHTYSTLCHEARTSCSILTISWTLTPKGRNETGEYGGMTDWVKHHDKYQTKAPENSSC